MTTPRKERVEKVAEEMWKAASVVVFTPDGSTMRWTSTGSAELLPFAALLIDAEEAMTKVCDAATIHCRCDVLVEGALARLRALLEPSK